MTYLIATIMGFVLSFFLTTVYYAVNYKMHVTDFDRSPPLKELLLAQHLIYGALLAYIYPKGFGGGRFWAEGAKFGALMGAVMFIPIGLSIRGAWLVPFDFPFILASAYAVLSSAVIGVAIAKVYDKKLRTADL